MEILNTTTNSLEPKILVIGIGGGGNNAIKRMANINSDHVDYAIFNTDKQILDSCDIKYKIQIGEKLTKGYGAGSNPAVGEAAAHESSEEISQLVENYDMVILTCGMGGGTGTGATPIIAEICKKKKILTIGVVTLPFKFEGSPRCKVAKAGIENLKKNIDTLLVIPNDKLINISVSNKPLGLNEAFALADNVLKYTVTSITSIIFNNGMINLDFNDLRTTLENKGIGHLGIGIVDDSSQIIDAFKQALESPLLDTRIEGSSNILINSSGDVNLLDINDAISYVQALAGEDVNIIWGTVQNGMADANKIVITIIATGMKDTTTYSSHPTASPSQDNLNSRLHNISGSNGNLGLGMNADFNSRMNNGNTYGLPNDINSNVSTNGNATLNRIIQPDPVKANKEPYDIKIPSFLQKRND
ncbi:cell division protein FtsZ [Lachnobacterium bovis]|uniref:cell division protein FtsZ n=1 Tax=Lachnobacterium bovis TaxID=140626 RepID=UPI0003B73723|nr:cell division protein FtsZ [Lachnobacterium bovis]